MIRQNRRLQFIILTVLVCLVASMTIAYAVLSTTLNIIGNAQIQNSSWNIRFDNINVNPNSVAITPKIIDNTKITFSANLTEPGDFYKFTVDIVNGGSIDAMIDSIATSPTLTTDQKKYLRFEIEYTDGQDLRTQQLLTAGETKTISVLFSFRTDIPTSDLPTTSTSFNVEMSLVYYQANDSATQITTGVSKVRLVSGDLNTPGSEFCLKNECFYLISNNGINATLITKYNLHVGNEFSSIANGATPLENPTGIQDEKAVGWFQGFSNTNPIIGVYPFSSGSTWQDVTVFPAYIYNSKSNLYPFVENYKSYIEQQGVYVENARLISYEELINLGCTPSSCASTDAWVRNTTYFTGSTKSSGYTPLIVYNYGPMLYNADADRDAGTRPVLEIPLTEF